MSDLRIGDRVRKGQELGWIRAIPCLPGGRYEIEFDNGQYSFLEMDEFTNVPLPKFLEQFYA